MINLSLTQWTVPVPQLSEYEMIDTWSEARTRFLLVHYGLINAVEKGRQKICCMSYLMASTPIHASIHTPHPSPLLHCTPFPWIDSQQAILQPRSIPSVCGGRKRRILCGARVVQGLWLLRRSPDGRWCRGLIPLCSVCIEYLVIGSHPLDHLQILCGFQCSHQYRIGEAETWFEDLRGSYAGICWIGVAEMQPCLSCYCFGWLLNNRCVSGWAEEECGA